jgi:hypothetical protein
LGRGRLFLQSLDGGGGVPRFSQTGVSGEQRIEIHSVAGDCVMRAEDIALAVVLVTVLLLSLWLVKDA